MTDRPFKQIVKDAEHYKAIGETRIYLMRDNDDFPWEYATKCEPGSSHRLDISTDARFTAKHPCGLEFTWSFDIEPRSANGSGEYQIDVDGIQRVMAKLRPHARDSFAEYLTACADAVDKRALEYQKAAQNQYGAAAALRQSATITAVVG